MNVLQDSKPIKSTLKQYSRKKNPAKKLDFAEDKIIGVKGDDNQYSAYMESLNDLDAEPSN